MKNTITIISLFLIAMAAHAGTFSMVEINPLHGNCQNLYTDSAKNYYGAGNLNHFARLNGLLYFVGADQAGNDELWVTDGSQAGTHLVKEINPNTGADIGDLRVVGNKIMFLANETRTTSLTTNDYDLYVSDGTEAGTMKVYDLNALSNTLLTEQSAGVSSNGKLIFCTNTDVMVSDGTAAGSRSLAAIAIASYTGGNGYCEMHGSVYFIVNNDIWKSDGTVPGTTVVKSVADTTNWPLAYTTELKAFDNKLYVIGMKRGEGSDLFVFDGTATGTVSKVLNYCISNTYPGSLALCGGSLWFTASDTSNYEWIYKLSSSAAQPQRVELVLGLLSYGNGKLYNTNLANNGYDVLDAVTNVKTSFSKSGLTLGFFGSLGGSNPGLVCMGDKMAFQAYDSASHQQVLCITDGTDAGTRIEMPIGITQIHPFDYSPSCGIIDLFDFTYYNDQLVIPANFNNAGRELWFYKEDGMSTGITDVELQSNVAVYPNPSNESVTIDVKAESKSAGLSVQIIDMKGSIMTERSMNDANASLSTSNLASGSYIVTVKSGNDMIARHRLTVVH